jgi:hypothetical protein
MARKTTKSKAPPPSSSIDPVKHYARAVLASEIITGLHVHLACERQLRELDTSVAQSEPASGWGQIHEQTLRLRVVQHPAISAALPAAHAVRRRRAN